MIFEKYFLGVPTDHKLKASELPKYQSICYRITSCQNLTIKIGDVITSSNVGLPIQVVSLDYRAGFMHLENVAINGIAVEAGNTPRPENKGVIISEGAVPSAKNQRKMTNNKMVSGLMDRYKSQFLPEKEENVKVSMDGVICVPINGEYIGVKSDGTLTSYPEQFLIDFPVFSICKPQAQIKVGDIIKNGRSYGRVSGKNENGTLKVVYFSGVTGDTQEIKDMLLGQSLVKVLVNMFNFNEGNNINPMMFLALSDKEDVDMKSLLLMQMMGNGQGLTANSVNGFNPLMLLALSDGESKSNDMFTTMALMQMMNGGNSLFGNTTTSNPTV